MPTRYRVPSASRNSGGIVGTLWGFQWPGDFQRGILRSQQGEVCCGNIFPEKTRRQHFKVNSIGFFSWMFFYVSVTRKNHNDLTTKKTEICLRSETVAAACRRLDWIGLDHWIEKPTWNTSPWIFRDFSREIHGETMVIHPQKSTSGIPRRDDTFKSSKLIRDFSHSDWRTRLDFRLGYGNSSAQIYANLPANHNLLYKNDSFP